MHRKTILSPRAAVLLSAALAAMSPAAAGPVSDAASFDLADFAGQTLYLDFWASWCAPCRESFPFMDTLVERYGDRGLRVVAVNLDADESAARAFLEALPATFDVVLDPAGRLAERFEPSTMPTTLIFDGAGQLVARHNGFFSARRDDYEATVIAALEGRLDPADPALVAGKKRRTRLGVEPWQRDLLARPDMQLLCDPLDLAYDDHVYFSKEGSAGGRGFGGGGCGCN